MQKLLLLLCLLPYTLYAQTQSGYYATILNDKNGKPIVGATIVNKTTKHSTTTAANGYFSIWATQGDIVAISTVGFSTIEVKILAGMLNQPLGKQPVKVLEVITVEPVLSSDYSKLVRSASDREGGYDSINNIQYASITVKNPSFYLPVKGVWVHNNELEISPALKRRMDVGGSYQVSLAVNTASRKPLLQNRYVQGRPENESLKWRGPETDEMFSFGPSVHELEYDGAAYRYDVNGQLVAKGNGNGSIVKPYNNTLLQKVFAITQSLHFYSNYYQGNNYLPLFFLRAGVGQTTQSTIIPQNRNNNRNFDITVGTNSKKGTLTGAYSHKMDDFSNTNRNGFLSRVYQNALLTPVSFSNQQGYLFTTGQRSYSNGADNPYFLLSDNGNGYRLSQDNASIVLEQKWKRVNMKVASSGEWVTQNNIENYKAGAVDFNNGMQLQRKQTDENYTVLAKAFLNLKPINYHHTSSLSANYTFINSNTNIYYINTTQTHWQYHRAANDFSLSFLNQYGTQLFNASLDIANKFYLSSTAIKNFYWLPSCNSSIEFKNVLEYVNVKFGSSLHAFASELPIQQSFAAVGLQQYLPQQAYQFIPQQEVVSYNELTPIKQQEWNNSVEIRYKNLLVLRAEYFTKNIKADIYPTIDAGQLLLKNLANHRVDGLEINLTYNSPYRYHSKRNDTHSLSFVSYRSKVTSVADKNVFVPIAGFRNIYKAVAPGYPLGVIVGTAWSRDKNSNRFIDSEGFPLIDSGLKVIGNPIPAFIVKLNNTFGWKKWTLNIDWEWQKGGDIWNGTAAILDYYGRSSITGIQRNISNYIFDGTLQDGQKNTIPVSFVDPRKSLEKNRWTRYGYQGVGEEYIQDGSYIKLNALSLSYNWQLKKYFNSSIILSAYLGNFFLWNAAKGIDPNTLLYDQAQSSGLQFFNIPSSKTVGLKAAVQF